MSQAPTAPTAKGYQPPQVTQFSVFLSNKVGKLLELLEIFMADPATQVVAVSVLDTADHAVVRIITSRSFQARKLLQKHRMAYSETEILVVEVNRSDDLAAICKTLLAAEINIHYAYPLMGRPRSMAALAIHTDNQVLAGQILRKHSFTFLGEDDLVDDSHRGDIFDLPSN